jgi:DNA-binding NarL/FixJ family response regulator
MAEYSILVVDDHPMIRHGLRDLLSQDKDLTALYEAASPYEALSLVSREKPDVVVLDLTFPDANGMALIASIRDASPKTEVVVFTMHVSPQMARQALKEGARGFVTKLDPVSHIVRAIAAVRNKQQFLSYQVLKDSVALPAIPGSVVPRDTIDPDAQTNLSPRESEVLKLLANGKTNKEIAKLLRLSVRTIDAHRVQVMRKMGFKSLAELIRFALRSKLIES